MGREDPRFLVVGHLNKAHGTKGELFVWPLTDHPAGVYAPGVILHVGDREGRDPDPDLPPLRVAQVRPFRRGYLVSFDGIGDRTQAELFTGRYLLREIEELEPLAEGELHYHQILGLRVVTLEGREVGEVTEVYELRPADLLEVSDGKRQVLVPFLESLVVRVDLESGVVIIDPPEGLLDL